MTIFEPENGLDVSSIHKAYIREKIYLSFSKWRIFYNSLLFSVKIAFFQISADFVNGFEKFIFHLKAHQMKMYIDENNFFVAQVFPEIYTISNRLINS